MFAGSCESIVRSAQEICTEDRYFDVSQREGPSVVSPHANVQGERLSTVRVYSGTVGCL